MQNQRIMRRLSHYLRVVKTKASQIISGVIGLVEGLVPMKHAQIFLLEPPDVCLSGEARKNKL